MRISTKGRYAMRVMIELARHGSGEYVPLRTLSERQNISEKYLEGILGVLVRSKILDGARGKGGGYRLNVDPQKCTVWDILSLTENSVAPVACLDGDEVSCDRAAACVTLPVWKELDTIIKDYLKSVTLDHFLRQKPLKNGEIPADSWNCDL